MELVEIDEVDRVLLVRRSRCREATSARCCATSCRRRPPPRRHLLSIADLDRDDVERLLGTARYVRALARARGQEAADAARPHRRQPLLRVLDAHARRASSSPPSGSRPTRCRSASSGSSVDKGESLKDTALTLAAYDPDVIVIRHPQIGAPQLVAAYTDAHVVNAGDGKHQHPTQALLDLYTMREALGRLDGLHVAIVGDVLHSRVARSLDPGARAGRAPATLVGPPTLIPRGIEALGCEVSYDIDAIGGRRRRLRPAHAARADARGRGLRALAARVHGALGGHAGAAAPGPAGDAPRPDEPRRRDRSARRRLRASR